MHRESQQFMSEKVEKTNISSINKLPGAALNAISPYFTMFPLDFPLSILGEHAVPGDEVIDPFCGRGTTNCASRLLGLKSYGIDSSHVAVATSEAKLVTTTTEKILEAFDTVLQEVLTATSIPEGEFWQWAFHPDVLSMLCRLREGLLCNSEGDARKALRAIIMGALHGPKNAKTPSYLSNQSPRTYAPKPRYAVNFWKERNLEPPKVDVRKIIEARAKRYYPEGQGSAEGKIICGDSRYLDSFSLIRIMARRIKWVITSPPYYGLRTYVPDQWLRNWFVGGTANVDYSSEGQLTHFSPNLFSADLRKVWVNLTQVCSPDAYMVIRFGAINDRKADHMKIIMESLNNSGWLISEVKSAGSAVKGKRQANSFLPNKSDAVEEVDIWAVRQAW